MDADKRKLPGQTYDTSYIAMKPHPKGPSTHYLRTLGPLRVPKTHKQGLLGPLG